MNTKAPIEFKKLSALVTNNTELDSAIEDLLVRKHQSLEKELIPAIPVLNNFVKYELDRLECYDQKALGRDVAFDELNTLFKQSIAESMEQ